jgi:hypothetical protein
MTRKKRFGISSDLAKGLSETINAVTDNIGQVRFEVISLDRIERDPQNPRELLITPTDIVHGISNNDPDIRLKQAELENLTFLSETIKR